MLDSFDPDEDVKVAMHKLHGCLEEHRDEMRSLVGGLETLIQRDRHTAANADAVLQGELRELGAKMAKGFTGMRAQMKNRTTQLTSFKKDLAAIKESVGAGKSGSTLAGLSQRKGISIAVVIAGLAAFPGIQALWRFLAPLATPAFAAVNHAMNVAPH